MEKYKYLPIGGNYIRLTLEQAQELDSYNDKVYFDRLALLRPGLEMLSNLNSERARTIWNKSLKIIKEDMPTSFVEERATRLEARAIKLANGTLKR